MQRQEARVRLRAILEGDRCVLASSLFDPMSARIGDELGFEVGLMGGSVASLAVLGAPDHIVITLTELAEQVRRVSRVARFCVLVDADHGYGNALNVMRTVEEGVGKMKAALEARGDSGMAIFGRTSAHAITGVDDAIRRLQAYEAAGVDALFVPGLKRREDLDRIAASVRLPLILGGVDESLAEPGYLATRRVRVWMAGHQAFAAGVQGMYEAMKAIRDGALPSQLKQVASKALMAKLTRDADYDAAMAKYLG